MDMNIRRLGFIAVAMTIFAIGASAQGLGDVDSALRKQIGASLTSYYGLKDSLVDSNSEAASTKAGEFLKALDLIDRSKMTAAQTAEWEKLGPRLRTDASHIVSNKDLGHQREHFMKLSNNMYALVFGFKANDAESYLHYCPMKKASWLSASKEVKNPYYGSKMLTCGSVKATLKKN